MATYPLITDIFSVSNEDSVFLYLMGSLRDSINVGGRLSFAWTEIDYRKALDPFLAAVTARTAGKKAANYLPNRAAIHLPQDGPARVHLIVQAPSGWTSERFQEVVAKLWVNFRWSRAIIRCRAKTASEMDLGFLKAEGRG